MFWKFKCFSASIWTFTYCFEFENTKSCWSKPQLSKLLYLGNYLGSIFSLKLGGLYLVNKIIVTIVTVSGKRDKSSPNQY